jgi:carboxypeptidase T
VRRKFVARIVTANSFFVFLLSANLHADDLSNPAANRKYASVREYLNDLALTHPKNAEVVKITDSDSGLPVEGLKIGSGTVSYLIVGTHHGNEYGATEVALAAAKDLAENPIPDRTIYVVPVLNISGYDRKNRYENSYDPNRDYPGPCGTDGPWHLKSTSGLAKFIDEKNIVSSATLHTFWPTVAYPWGTSTNDFATLYDDMFKDLAKAATFLSHYEIGYSGAVIYPADGTFEDYAFWKHGIWSLLFEIGGSHNPSASEVDELLRVNVPGLRKMMEDAPTTRAENHNFTASCSKNKGVDLHIE